MRNKQAVDGITSDQLSNRRSIVAQTKAKERDVIHTPIAA